MNNKNVSALETRIDKNGVSFRVSSLDQCPHCSNLAIEKLMDAIDYEGDSGQYSVCRCSYCETLFCNPQVVTDDIPNLYEARDTQDFNPSVNRSSLIYRLRTLHAKSQIKGLLSRACKPNSFDAMDFGCGDGMFSLALAKASGCRHLTAVDFHPEAPETLRNSGVGYVSVADLSAGMFASSFDIIICRHIVEHVSFPEQFISKMSTYLKPGGYLFVEVPNYESLWRRVFGKYWSILYVPRHLYWFTERNMRTIFRGVEIIDIYRCNTPTIGGSLQLKFGLPINNTDIMGVMLYPFQLVLERIFGTSSTLIAVTRRPLQRIFE
jgi:2-polyprenyl-3-methyl-5-hydroxy-6-metoxy-1,4-benzoquinol methylase